MFRDSEIIAMIEELTAKVDEAVNDSSFCRAYMKKIGKTMEVLMDELGVNESGEIIEGEKWKPVPLTGFKTKYEVSNMGRVRSSHGRHKGKILTAYTENGTKAKKRRVGMRTASGATTRYIDWLVASAFVEPYRGSRVAHIDGDNHNDRADNLKWVW